MSVTTLQTNPVTAHDMAGKFLVWLKRKGKAQGTLDRYGPDLNAFGAWAGQRRLSEVTAVDIDFDFFPKWIEDFEARNSRQPSQATLKALHGSLSSMYRFATNYAFLVDEEGRAVSNPMLAVEAPKVSQRRNDWLRGPEDEVLLDTPMDARESILVLLPRWAGLRLGEQLALREQDVDLVSKTIYVDDSKTENGIRELPILPDLVPAIKTWREYKAKHGLSTDRGLFLCTTQGGNWRDPKTKQVVTSEPGQPLKPQQVEKIVRRVGERAGIERLTPHRLRRTFGSFFLNEGVRLESVSKLLGHANTSVTEERYAQLLSQTIRRELHDVLGVRRSA